MNRRALMSAVLAPSRGVSGPPPESVTFELAPVSEDLRRRAFMEGRGGSSGNGAHLMLPANANGVEDVYVWCSQGGRNMDPGDHVVALAGWTGIEVALDAGMVDASTRATAYASAINTAGIAGLSASAVGGQLTVSGNIDAVSCAPGGAYTARGAAGLFGHHTSADFTNGNPFNDAIAVHGTFTAGPGVLSAIGVLLGTPSGESVRVAFYTGGTSTSFTGTTLIADGIVTATGSGNVWAWLTLTAAQSAMVADNASVWVVAKANAGGTLFPAFSTLAASEDWTARNLVIFSGINTDPTVAWPSTLEGEPSDIDTGNAVVMMAAFEYRTAPFVGDCSLGGATTQGIRFGMHTDNVLAASESALTSPDPLGANVLAGLVSPSILGMLETRRETALHDVSGGAMRTAEYSGGAVGDPDGATVLQDHGAVTAGATMEWVGQNASPEVAIPAATPLHLAIRGNGGITVGYVDGSIGGNDLIASPPDNPSDFAVTATDEYETNTDNPAHSTNDATAFETPFNTSVTDIQPGNWPGMRVYFRVPGDAVV